MFQCLEVITEALKDPYLHDSKRLSLLQRARKICQSRVSAAEEKPKKKTVVVGKRQRMSSRNSIDMAFQHRIEDFPKMDIIEAPEVGGIMLT